MLKKIFSLSKEELIRGSFTLFVMVNIFNFLNYIFHFSMARILGPADYGILAVLMSVVYIFAIPGEGIQTIISRYTSKYNIKKENGKIKYILIRAAWKLIFIAMALFIAYIPIAFFLSYFNDIEVGLMIFTGILLFGIFLIPVTRGVIQGSKKFKSLGFNMILESALKVVLSIILVLLGLKVYGAIGGVILGVLIAFIASFFSIKKILKSKIEKTKLEGFHSYSFPVFLVMLTIMFMVSLDIIFAKRFFPAELAGKYAVISMLGKMIFFGTFGIGKAMFSLTSESYDKGEKTKNIFRRAFFIVLFLCIIAVLIYWIFPELIINLLFGSQYAELANILVFSALAFSFISLGNLSLLYSLAIKKKKIWMFAVFVFLEILVFLFFHKNITEFSIGFMTINFIMFVISLVFAIRD